MQASSRIRRTSRIRLPVGNPIASHGVTGLQASAVIPATSWVAALQQTPLPPADSVVVESPLPTGIAAVTRFLLTTVPQGVQIAGVVLAAIVAALFVWYLVRHRQAIRHWLASRSRATLLALGATAVIVVAVVAGLGAASYNYVQHSNEFCTSCHVMGPAFQKFGSAENKHAELSCHDCHQQSMLDSMHELYVWVRERPEEIGAHAEVPNRVCESCHVTGDTATWQRVAATAGHRVHLESDSSALKDVQCVTCHGQEVHRFKPVSVTCGQSGCHDQEATNIALGKMATQTSIHCTSCHGFTSDVPALATTDSARGTLTPGQPQCLGCHQMQTVLPDFDPARDPHGGKCGTCHNPHEQKAPDAAAQTCATAACHGNWRTEPFHVGAAHRRIAPQCLTCHTPHSARVDASDCAGCHANARARGNPRPPVPFDTTRALRRVSSAPAVSAPAFPPPTFAGHWPAKAADAGDAPTAVRGAHVSLPPESDDIEASDDNGGFGGVGMLVRGPGSRTPVPWPPPASADTFSHPRHAKLACLVCHQTGEGHGRLTFERPRGCAICHHQAPATARCATCHQTDEVATPKPVSLTVTVPGRPPATRPVDFFHDKHTSRRCVDCHTTPVTLAPSPAAAQCRDCHSDHHAADRACASCHAISDPKAQHTTLDAAHQRCDACHTPATVASLTPTRSFCAACHAAKATKHYDDKECSTCHFLAEPGAYRAKLTSPPR